MHAQLLRFKIQTSTITSRPVLAVMLCIATVCWVSIGSADDSPTPSAAEKPTTSSEEAMDTDSVRFVSPKPNKKEAEKGSEKKAEQSVMKIEKPKVDAKPAAGKKPTPPKKSEPKPAEEPEAKPTKPARTVKLARKPRLKAGPIVTAAQPYRYRYKRPGGDVIVKRPSKPADKSPVVKNANPVNEPKKPNTDVVQNPPKKPDPIKSPPTDVPEKPPVDDVAQEPKKESKPEPKADPPEAKAAAPGKIEVASFSGVQPGATTQEELVRKWGNPTKSESMGKRQTLVFSIEPFDNIRVTLSEEKVVETIAITLAKLFPAEVVAKQLGLSKIEPTPVVDGAGKPLGQSFPERGVTFAYAANAQKPVVTKILLTPIRTAPFLARVSSNLEKRYKENSRDLDYVLKQEPDNSRAWWLKSRVLLSAGRPFAALDAVKDAIRLQPDMPEYRLTRARIGGAIGKFEEAIQETKDVVLQSSLTPEVKARGMTLLGDLLAAKPQPDFEQAVKYHMLAIKVADPLGIHKKARVRREAKHVLLDAHLAVATDIARGQWKNQQKVVPQWIQRADLLVKDLRTKEGANEEVRLRLLRSALAACAAVDGRIDPSTWAAEADVVGQKLIAQATDPTVRGRLQWQLGTALLDGLKAEHARGQHTRAIALGKQALTLLTPTNAEAYPMPERNFTVGQIHFRIGAIYAIHRKNHKEAVRWYDKAVPWLEKPLPPSLASQLGPHGETFISMGVSFWSTGNREHAVDLTEQGTHLLEQAVERQLLEKSALGVAYNNLSSMHDKLGDDRKSKKFSEMATRIKESTRGARR